MIIKKVVTRILRIYRDWINAYIYKDYDDNPFNVKAEETDAQEYLNLSEFAKKQGCL